MKQNEEQQRFCIREGFWEDGKKGEDLQKPKGQHEAQLLRSKEIMKASRTDEKMNNIVMNGGIATNDIALNVSKYYERNWHLKCKRIHLRRPCPAQYWRITSSAFATVSTTVFFRLLLLPIACCLLF